MATNSTVTRYSHDDDHDSHVDPPSVYRRLNPLTKEIRLLLLKAGKAEDPLCCEIKYTSILAADSTAYETISYVWGDATIRGQILINGCRFDVPLSSEEVLRRMRLNDADRLVWLDAISIHQHDLDERNHQVAMMAYIYSNAVQNLVWLGDSESDPKSSVDAILSVIEDARCGTDDFFCFLSTIFDAKTDAWKYSTKGFETRIDFEAVKRFFARPWFGRLWVVQEAALAQHSVCFYNNLQLPLLDVLRAAAWLLHKEAFLPFRPAHELGIRRAARIWNFSDNEQGIFTPDGLGSPDYFQLLANLQLFQASEPRDHVYGMLGLYQKLHSGTLPMALMPDYGRSLADILSDATRLAVEDQHSLECLNYLPELCLGNESAPSWMPRWHLQPDGRQHPGSFFWEGYSACGKHMHHSMIKRADQDSSVLITNGFLVDKISRIVLSPEQDTGVEVYIEGLREIGKAVNSKADKEALIALALIAEKDYRYKMSDVTSALDGFKAWKCHLDTTNTLPPRARDLKTEMQDPSPELLKAAEYMQAFYNACRARSIFVTESGRLGIGMKRVQPADEIAIMWGCRLPVIVRRLPESLEHAAVCVSYVSGIMHGEAAVAHEARGGIGTTFLLR